MMFDDALDMLRDESATFDCVYLDGQHERQATLHYMERIRPLLSRGGAVVFDDIYWSDDMNQAWKDLCRMDVFSQTLDFGSKGVCVLRSGDETHVHYDVCDYIGRPRIGRRRR